MNIVEYLARSLATQYYIGLFETKLDGPTHSDIKESIVNSVWTLWKSEAESILSFLETFQSEIIEV